MIYIPTIIDAEKDSHQFMRVPFQSWEGTFGQYSPFYHIATEAVSTYVPAMGDNFTTALTVGASGDQGIALNQRGTKDVYFFDLNRADVYWLMLKKVAFETLKRKDFLDFMIAESNGEILNYNLYKKIQNRLTLPIRIFWDNIYKTFNYNHHLIRIYLFRDTKKNSSKSKIVNDYYSNNSSYYEAQKRVQNSNWHFIESDLYSLDVNLPKDLSFDAIILSNIYEYLNFAENVSKDNALKYLTFIRTVLLPRLNKGGACMFAYLCQFDESVSDSIAKQLLSDPNFWISSTQEEAIKKGLQGYSTQNLSYHYLYEEVKNTPGVQMVKTPKCGYGMSHANTDLALIQRK